MTTPILHRAVELACARPGTILAWVLGIHLVVWTVIPILVCSNLQLDLVEDLALGKEWQLGYWKHPPLPWWLADAAYRLTGRIESVYVLGPLAAVLCLYFVYRLGRDIAGPQLALVAVLALEGLHFFNFSAVKFAHDQMQLPFWALTGWFFYRALAGRRPLDWVAAGIFLALAFWSKYAAVPLAVTLGCILLFDRDARTAWRGSGPYLMAAAFLVVLSPNLWWLVEHDFLPLRYVNDRAVEAVHWYDYLLFPLRWTLSQLFFLLPTIALLAIFYFRRGAATRSNTTSFAKRYIAGLGFGPFIITTLVAALAGRLPVAMWGYPLWMFTPLAVLVWYAPSFEARRFNLFAAGFAAIFLVLPAAYLATELLQPMLSHRSKATDFPGRAVAEIITRQWRDKFGTPLRYVGGIGAGRGPGEFAANNVAVYSPDRPHVVVHGDPRLSPWIDPADLARRGAVFVWEEGGPATRVPADIEEAFPHAVLQPALVLPQLSRFSRTAAVISYAILPPQP
ncbi:MAG: glycosyltransferase family 39 protein [Pseudolabrys sp.]